MAKIDELKRPTLPGAGDMTKVNTASAGVSAAKDAVTNMNYDTFKQGSGYAGLKKSYEQQGQKAMQDTLGQMAARTGGMASSYAGSAAQQSYNGYMQTLEDAARSMFNDEYSRAKDNYNMALQEYNNAYGEYRDQKSDAWTKYNAENSAFESDRTFFTSQEEKAKQDEEDRVYNLAYYGTAPSFAEYQAAGGTLDQATYDSIILKATGTKTNANKTTRDTEIKGILEGKEFQWGDWDGDGTVEGDSESVSADDFFSGSSYGADYWQSIFQNAQEGYTSESQADAADDITSRIANGESLEDIAKEYGIDGKNKTWESVTGMSQAQWQEKVNSQSETTKTDAQEIVKDIWATGGNPTNDEDLKKAGYMDEDGNLTAAGKLAKAKATGRTDSDLKALFEGEDFDWDTYDFDGDGTVEGENEDMSTFFVNSTLGGADYWRSIFDAAKGGRIKQEQDTAVNDIMSRIANGESLEAIAEVYGIGPNNAKSGSESLTWEDITGKSEAEWQEIFNNNQVKNYTYSNDEKGATAIMNSLVNSASFSLTDKDQANFDYIYGDGAYDAVQKTLSYARNIRADDQGLYRDFDALYDDLANRFPLFTNAQIMGLLYAANPEAYAVWGE